jgi:hypothetical protein
LEINTNRSSEGLREIEICGYTGRREEINININVDIMDFLSVGWSSVAEVGLTDRLLCIWQ